MVTGFWASNHSSAELTSWIAHGRVGEQDHVEEACTRMHARAHTHTHKQTCQLAFTQISCSRPAEARMSNMRISQVESIKSIE